MIVQLPGLASVCQFCSAVCKIAVLVGVHKCCVRCGATLKMED